MEELKVRIDGRDYIVKIEEGTASLKVHLDGKIYTVETSKSKEQKDYSVTDKSASGREKEGLIMATLPGVISSVDLKAGDSIKRGQKILSFLAMKMENQVFSPRDGKIKEIKIKKGDKINKGDLLAIIE